MAPRIEKANAGQAGGSVGGAKESENVTLARSKYQQTGSELRQAEANLKKVEEEKGPESGEANDARAAVKTADVKNKVAQYELQAALGLKVTNFRKTPASQDGHVTLKEDKIIAHTKVPGSEAPKDKFLSSAGSVKTIKSGSVIRKRIKMEEFVSLIRPNLVEPRDGGANKVRGEYSYTPFKVTETQVVEIEIRPIKPQKAEAPKQTFITEYSDSTREIDPKKVEEIIRSLEHENPYFKTHQLPPSKPSESCPKNEKVIDEL